MYNHELFGEVLKIFRFNTNDLVVLDPLLSFTVFYSFEGTFDRQNSGTYLMQKLFDETIIYR